MCVREKLSCCACLLDGKADQGGSLSPRRPLIPASSTRAAAADGGQDEAPQDKVLAPAEKEAGSLDKAPISAPFFLGMGFLQGTWRLSLSEPEVRLQAKVAGPERECSELSELLGHSSPPTAPLKGSPTPPTALLCRGRLGRE